MLSEPANRERVVAAVAATPSRLPGVARAQAGGKSHRLGANATSAWEGSPRGQDRGTIFAWKKPLRCARISSDVGWGILSVLTLGSGAMLPSARTSERKVLAVIPARYGSTRLPGKVLMQVAGKPVVQHVYERTCQAQLVDEVVVATDDERVVEALRQFGTNVVMTRADHPSGTDRIAEVAASSAAEIIVNVQGCEAIIDPRMIDEAIRPLLDDPTVRMATLKHRIADESEIDDPHVVKVVTDMRDRALYFSRAPIPAIRDAADSEARAWCYFKHIGLYVYRRDFLLSYAKMKPTPIEKLEKLEQLRALENGFDIVVVETEFDSVGVDTMEAFEKVKRLLEG